MNSIGSNRLLTRAVTASKGNIWLHRSHPERQVPGNEGKLMAHPSNRAVRHLPALVFCFASVFSAARSDRKHSQGPSRHNRNPRPFLGAQIRVGWNQPHHCGGRFGALPDSGGAGRQSKRDGQLSRPCRFNRRGRGEGREHGVARFHAGPGGGAHDRNRQRRGRSRSARPGR